MSESQFQDAGDPAPGFGRRRFTVSIDEFEEGGFGLVAPDGEVRKAASTLAEILEHVYRGAHRTFTPPSRVIERLAPNPPPQMPTASMQPPSLIGRVARVVGGRG